MCFVKNDNKIFETRSVFAWASKGEIHHLTGKKSAALVLNAGKLYKKKTVTSYFI